MPTYKRTAHAKQVQPKPSEGEVEGNILQLLGWDNERTLSSSESEKASGPLSVSPSMVSTPSIGPSRVSESLETRSRPLFALREISHDQRPHPNSQPPPRQVYHYSHYSGTGCSLGEESESETSFKPPHPGYTGSDIHDSPSLHISPMETSLFQLRQRPSMTLEGEAAAGARNRRAFASPGSFGRFGDDATRPSPFPISPPLLDRIRLDITSTSTFANDAPNHERSYDIPSGASMPTFVHGAPNRERFCNVPHTASATTFRSSATYCNLRPLKSARHFSAARARKPRERYPEYMPRIPLSLAAAESTREPEEGGRREEVETHRWKAPETEAKRQREGSQSLHDISTNTADFNDLASRQLLRERLDHIEVLEGCLVELDSFHGSLGERIERLEDMFWSLREPEVFIDGYVIELSNPGRN
jgi:hypothetical protein